MENIIIYFLRFSWYTFGRNSTFIACSTLIIILILICLRYVIVMYICFNITLFIVNLLNWNLLRIGFHYFLQEIRVFTVIYISFLFLGSYLILQVIFIFLNLLVCDFLLKIFLALLIFCCFLLRNWFLIVFTGFAIIHGRMLW